jgi:hypothetical protein
MKPFLNCRDAAALVLMGEDRHLSLRERVMLRLHLAICSACSRFVGQVNLMHGAMGQWRAYRADERDDAA